MEQTQEGNNMLLRPLLNLSEAFETKSSGTCDLLVEIGRFRYESTLHKFISTSYIESWSGNKQGKTHPSVHKNQIRS